jgi:uncharacterized membrane protein YecN with MAPEG domain
MGWLWVMGATWLVVALFIALLLGRAIHGSGDAQQDVPEEPAAGTPAAKPVGLHLPPTR